ncbi:MAG TPA: hybrid sensor histidine kinase/response regulator [Burkholderiales bacterium]|nr:hybrid sensor histidine kinase/response regulator [Burkholderiales bacterium]
MRLLTLNAELRRLVIGCLFVIAACAAPAALIATGLTEVDLEDPELWKLALCAAAAIVLPLLLIRVHAEELAAALASLHTIAKAQIVGLPATVPSAVRTRELDAAATALVHAANTVRQREFNLRAADRLKDEFLATLAHELRNPLSAISAASYLLGKTASDPAAQRSASVLARQVEHMNRMIEDLLDVNRLTRGKLRLSRGPLDLAALVRRVVEEMRLAGRLDAHELRVDAADVWVRADESRIQQVVANLVGNAVKYSHPGGRIAVTLRRAGDTAVLRVLDNGIGMSQELAARIFDPFVQGQDLGHRGAGGLGIGLTIVKHLVELHGGHIFAASGGPGQGSIFTVEIPAIERQSLPRLDAPAATEQPRHRILLVDDNADERDTMFLALEHEGHRVYEAADTRAGVSAVRALRPDAAVIDIGSAALDGYAIASTLRDDPARSGMVLIALTGLERPDTLRLAREAGFDEFLAKPIAPDQLLRAIDAAQTRRASR